MGIITTVNTSAVSAYLQLVGGVALSASLTSITDQYGNVSPLQIATASIGLGAPTFMTLANWTQTLGSKDGFYSLQSVNVASAGTGVFRMIRNSYTINNTAAQTGSVTGYFLNATETNLNGMTHNLMDLQVGGVSKFLFSRTGTATFALNVSIGGDYVMTSSGAQIRFGLGSKIGCSGDGIINFLNLAENGFNRANFGGTTNLFPAIKRNGAELYCRLADDSNFCNIGAQDVNARGVLLNVNYGYNRLLDGALIGNSSDLLTPLSLSAIFQLNSTTKGFLMPRMTETQINTIASPADGLMVYNTDQKAPCFYNGSTMQWQKISHAIM